MDLGKIAIIRGQQDAEIIDACIESAINLFTEGKDFFAIREQVEYTLEDIEFSDSQEHTAMIMSEAERRWNNA